MTNCAYDKWYVSCLLDRFELDLGEALLLRKCMPHNGGCHAMSLEKHLILEKPRVFTNRFFPFYPELGDEIRTANWDLISKVIPKLRPIVLKSGVDEAMDMFLTAYQQELNCEDHEGTEFAMLMLAQSFEDKPWQ